MKELRFDGRVAVVTGAGGNPGLGRSYAMLLAARGAKVVVNDLAVGPDGRGAIGTGPEQVVAEIRASGGEAVANTDSVADRDGANRIGQTALDTWGRLDIVINNAGIALFALFDEISDHDIDRVVRVHLMGHIWTCRAAWPHMKSNQYGRLVNISSSVAVKGMTHQSVYSAAKLGVSNRWRRTPTPSQIAMAHQRCQIRKAMPSQPSNPGPTVEVSGSDPNRCVRPSRRKVSLTTKS